MKEGSINSTLPKEDAFLQRAERIVFLFLVFLLAPMLAVVSVGGYGLLIWLSQLLS